MVFNISCLYVCKSKKVKSDYFIVRPKVDQRAGQLSLPHLGIFAIHTRYFFVFFCFFLFKLIYIAP